MNKRTLLIKIAIIFIVILSGCAKSNEENILSPTPAVPLQKDEEVSLDGIVLPSVEENYFDVLCENNQIVIYLGSGGTNALEFRMVSSKNLKNKNITLCSDIGEPVEITIMNIGEEQTMPFYMFLNYQNFPWKEYAKEKENFAGEIETYQKIYQQVLSQLPKLYFSRFFVSYEQLGINKAEAAKSGNVSSITVTVDGQSKEYQTEKLNFNEEPCPKDKSGGGMYFTNSVVGVAIVPNAAGEVKIPAIQLKVKEDVVLQSLFFAGREDVLVTDCNITVRPESGGMWNTAWDIASPLEVDAGSELSMDIILEDPVMANLLYGNVMYYLVLNYTNQGETYAVQNQSYFSIVPHPHEVYAQKVDSIDVMPYYIEYYNCVD